MTVSRPAADAIAALVVASASAAGTTARAVSAGVSLRAVRPGATPRRISRSRSRCRPRARRLCNVPRGHRNCPAACWPAALQEAEHDRGTVTPRQPVDLLEDKPAEFVARPVAGRRVGHLGSPPLVAAAGPRTPAHSRRPGKRPGAARGPASPAPAANRPCTPVRGRPPGRHPPPHARRAGSRGRRAGPPGRVARPGSRRRCPASSPRRRNSSSNCQSVSPPAVPASNSIWMSRRAPPSRTVRHQFRSSPVIESSPLSCRAAARLVRLFGRTRGKQARGDYPGIRVRERWAVPTRRMALSDIDEDGI